MPKPSYGDVRVADADAPLLSSMNAGKGESSLIEAEPAKPEGKKALCISILTLLLSIPALIGA